MGKKTTQHIFEPFVTLEEIGGLPLSLTAAVFSYGNDRDALDKNYYSSYFELGYSRSIGDFGFTAFAGGTLKEGYYASKAALVNVGCGLSKDLKITDSFTIPVKGLLIINPNTENVFFVFSMTF